MYDFYEFFAGGGMVRAGLGKRWRCLLANDFDSKKGATYRRNWGDDSLRICDVKEFTAADLPRTADLAWASFPCQDLSLAGGGAGLSGDRSGAFWPFWALLGKVIDEGRAPSIVVLENVVGTLTSHGGRDFSAICAAYRESGYRCGAVVIDAARFVPQSRPRLFIIGTRTDREIPPGLELWGDPSPLWHTRTLKRAYTRLPEEARSNWVWWSLPEPRPRRSTFADLVEDNPASVNWHTWAETRKLLGMMSEIHLAKVEAAKRTGRRLVGTVYKRTRRDSNGERVQRAEIRFDDVAGCLRTPAGGSSRQLIVVVEGKSVRSRLISTRETSRLMGLADEYELPTNYNEAYHLTGDGVVVPAVRYLAEHILEPILDSQRKERSVA